MSKYQNIFNQDFYPTPNNVLYLMNLEVRNKIVLEPSAGKGNIIDYLNLRGAKNIFYCEINNDLKKILQTKKANFIKSDFLEVTAEEVSHIDIIVMNPPFSDFKKHLKHAWNVAPNGCEIVCLGNNNTVESIMNRYNRDELRSIIEDYGVYDNLGNVFANAERTTETEIALIKLNKPIKSDSINFDDYFDNLDDDIVRNSEGIVKFGEIDAMVNAYKYIIKHLQDIYKNIDFFKNMIKDVVGIDLKVDIGLQYKDDLCNQERFMIQLQKIYWARIFEKMKIDKYISSEVKKDINKFIERQQKLPFTKKNIFKMIEIIIGTKDQTFKRSIENVIDNFTRHTHENRYNVEGWKTNTGHLLNKKFIINCYFQKSYSGNSIETNSYSRVNELEDLEKVLCVLSGKNYDLIYTINDKINGVLIEENQEVKKEKKYFGRNYIYPNTWYESEFFEFKGFKKGTIHIKFKDLKLWEALNREYAKIKGNVLPEKI